MVSEWRERPLGELIDNFDSFRVPVKEADRRPGPYPYYGASGIVDYVDGYLFDGEYLLIAEDGENLRTRNMPVAFLVRGKFWVNNHAHIVKGNGEADTRFLMYALKAVDISGYLTGSTMPKLTQGNMNRVPIHAPQLDEQRTIAHILGTLDDKIDLNRRMNETLEATAQALFDSWFADAIQDGLPAGWRIERLGDVAEVNWGDTNTTKASYSADGFAAYSASGRDGFLPYHDFDRTGVIVSAIGANAGASWLALGKWSCIKNTIRFWAKAEDVSTEYLFYATRGKNKWPLRGSAQPFIAQGDARAMEVIVPANKLARRFGEIAQPIHLKIHANEDESRTLAALRDALLAKLLCGKVPVRP